MSTLRVVAIVREPVHILSRFVTWYLGAGATGITLFFDDPADPAIPVVTADPRVMAIPCTPELWAMLGRAPDDPFTKRQNTAYSRAYSATKEDWVLIVDADELVYLRDGTLPDLLADQPADVRSLRIEPAEYVHGPDDAAGASFRLTIGKRAVNDIYGEDSGIFRKRFGLVGHSAGKSFHRTGQTGLRMRQHWAVEGGEDPVPARMIGRGDGAFLLHYFAPDYDIWRGKIEWRISASGFNAEARDRIEAILAAGHDREAAIRDLYNRMHRIDAARADALRTAGGLLDLAPAFGPAQP